MAENKENCIEFLTGKSRACGSFTSQKFINRIKRLAESYQDQVSLAENEDGSVCAGFPLSWVKLSPPRQMSEEQRANAAERLKQLRSSKSDELH